MNYEFYFLRDTEPNEPQILRVMAPSFDNAAALVARQYGWTAAAENRRRIAEYIESIDIRPVEIQNIFEPRPSSAALR
jgi:propanediol dehydratase small subunit